MNVFGRLLARDLCHGRKRVSPFYHVQQLLHEKNVFRSPGNGTFFFHLARSLGRSRQRVAPFYHLDLGLDLVGLIGNFWIVEQLVPLVVVQLLNPILSSSHVSRRSLEAAEVTHIFLVYDFSSCHPNNFRKTTSWECFVKNDSVRSCLIELQSFPHSKIDVDPIYCVLMSLPCFMYVLLHDTVHSSRSYQDPHGFLSMGSTGRKNTACLLLKC